MPIKQNKFVLLIPLFEVKLTNTKYHLPSEGLPPTQDILRSLAHAKTRDN